MVYSIISRHEHGRKASGRKNLDSHELTHPGNFAAAIGIALGRDVVSMVFLG
jgi:hypothetical protein